MHYDILNTCNSNSATSTDFIFCVRAGVMEILLFLGHPCFMFELQAKKNVYIIVYMYLKIFFIKNIFYKYYHEIKKLNFVTKFNFFN